MMAVYQWAQAPPSSASEHAKSAGEGFVSMFEGGAFKGWKWPEGLEGHWTINDGVVASDGKARAVKGGEKNLWTEKSYKDFVLKVDWRLPAKPELKAMNDFSEDGLFKTDEDGNRLKHEIMHAGDSGVYLRGSSRAQVNIWSQPMGSGDINAYHKDAKLPEAVRRACMPKVNADAPSGEWNRFVITMRGDRVTVVLNGKTVIDHAKLPGVPKTGPIALQNHGDPIEFRNLYIKELPEKATLLPPGATE